MSLEGAVSFVTAYPDLCRLAGKVIQQELNRYGRVLSEAERGELVQEVLASLLISGAWDRYDPQRKIKRSTYIYSQMGYLVRQWLNEQYTFTNSIEDLELEAPDPFEVLEFEYLLTATLQQLEAVPRPYDYAKLLAATVEQVLQDGKLNYSKLARQLEISNTGIRKRYEVLLTLAPMHEFQAGLRG